MSPKDYKNALQGLKNKREYKACLRLLRSNYLIELNDLRWNPYHWSAKKKERYIHQSNELIPYFEKKQKEFEYSNPKKSEKYSDLIFKRNLTHQRFSRDVWANKVPIGNSLYESI